MTREKLLSSPEYWTAELQMELYRQIESYMSCHGLNKAQLAEHLGCSKSYITQLLSGDFDHKMSKFFELSLSIGKIPEFTFTDKNEYIEMDSGNSNNQITINISTKSDCYNPTTPIIESAA
jgi:transcriptional regulator with XRE-family HTH domain